MYQKSSDAPTFAFSRERSSSSTTEPSGNRPTSSEAVSGALRTRTFEAIVMRCFAAADCRATTTCACVAKAKTSAADAKSRRRDDHAAARPDLFMCGKFFEPSGVKLPRAPDLDRAMKERHF